MTGLAAVAGGLSIMSCFAALLCLGQGLIAWDAEESTKPYNQTAGMFFGVALAFLALGVALA